MLQDAVVSRVDDSLGLLLQLGGNPSPGGGENPREIPSPARGFVHISNVAEGHVEKLGKGYKVGQKLAARVTGARYRPYFRILFSYESHQSWIGCVMYSRFRNFKHPPQACR